MGPVEFLFLIHDKDKYACRSFGDGLTFQQSPVIYHEG